jgi:hypothetical protein
MKYLFRTTSYCHGGLETWVIPPVYQPPCPSGETFSDQGEDESHYRNESVDMVLSIPHDKHALATRPMPTTPFSVENPLQDKTLLPAKIAPIHSLMRLSKFSLKTNQARRAVKTPSRLRRREVVAALLRDNPNIKRTGARIPPKKVASLNQSQSLP